MKKLILFDFDGTLADVEAIMLSLYNQLAGKYKFEPITEEEIPLLRDMGAKTFIKQRTRLHWWQIPGVLKKGTAEYKKLSPSVSLFAGTPELLSELKKKGFVVGILSSNDPETIRDILDRYQSSVDFIYHGSLFGKAKKITKILKEMRLSPQEAWYVGDEVRDAEAAKKASVDCVSVTWGLNSEKVLKTVNTRTAGTVGELSSLLLA